MPTSLQVARACGRTQLFLHDASTSPGRERAKAHGPQGSQTFVYRGLIGRVIIVFVKREGHETHGTRSVSGDPGNGTDGHSMSGNLPDAEFDQRA